MREKIIELATKEIGYAEKSGNVTKFGEWFGFNGVPWCAIFCSWCYSMAGMTIKGGGFKNGFAGCQTAMVNFKSMITKTPKPGDLVLFDWQSDKRADHVGIFVAWIDNKAGTFFTIEGNTSTANQSNGGMVMKRQRNMAKVTAFINLIG